MYSSAYLMREGANEKSSPQLTQISRVRLPRAAKSSQGKQRQVIDMRSVRGGRTRGSGSRGRGRCQSEQIIDDEVFKKTVNRNTSNTSLVIIFTKLRVLETWNIDVVESC